MAAAAVAADPALLCSNAAKPAAAVAPEAAREKGVTFPAELEEFPRRVLRRVSGAIALNGYYCSLKAL